MSLFHGVRHSDGCGSTRVVPAHDRMEACAMSSDGQVIVLMSQLPGCLEVPVCITLEDRGINIFYSNANVIWKSSCINPLSSFLKLSIRLVSLLFG